MEKRSISESYINSQIQKVKNDVKTRLIPIVSRGLLGLALLSAPSAPVSASTIQNETSPSSVPSQSQENPDWVMEDIQACTYKSSLDWKIKSSFIVRNAGLVPALSNTASISVDANSYNRATNSIFYIPVPALEPGQTFSISADQVIYSGCDNECPAGVKTQFDVDVSGLPDVNYENNHKIITANVCEQPNDTAVNLQRRAFLPSVQR